MRIEWFRFQLGMELDTDEPRVTGYFDNLRQRAVGRHAGKLQTGFFKLFAVCRVDLVTVAVTLGDFLGSVPVTSVGGTGEKTEADEGG